MTVQTAGKTESNLTNVRNRRCKWYIWCVSFYNRHFPTDRRSYNIRLPFLGWILSLFSFHFILSRLLRQYMYQSGNGSTFLIIISVVLTFGPAYGLNWGLEIGDRKHYSPWILLKIFEILLALLTIILTAIDGAHPRFYYLKYIAGELAYGCITLLLNCIITYVVIKKSLHYLGRPASKKMDIENNIYDFEEVRTYDNV